MSQELRTLDQNIIASLVIKGDLKGLNPQQKVEYYNYRCNQAGLDPAAKPFDLLVLNGKEILYANASATQQLTGKRNLSHQITGRELVDGVYCVFCRVSSPDGQSTENMGAVPIEGLKGEAKANAMLKATTKAIRRTVLAHCGLGMMDETETETIPGAVKAPLPTLDAPAAYEWTEDDYKTAGQALMDFCEGLDSAGVPIEKIEAASAKCKASIGDESITCETWLNRVTAMAQRVIDAHRKAA